LATKREKSEVNSRAESDAVNIREADIGPLETSDHRVHHAPLPAPVVSLERCATVHIHRYAALANNYRTLAKGAVTSFHESADLGGEIITCSLLTPVESFERVHALTLTYQIGVAK